MNISDELERILGEMDEDERKKAEESNTAKQMALLAEGGTAKSLPAGTHDMIHELRASMYGADPTNTHMPQNPDLATQFMQFLAQMYMPGLVAPQANVPTAAQGSYADVPSHASGGSIGYHQPGSLEQNMMALGGDKAIPIIMALHKAAGGNVEGAQSPKSESPSADDSGGLFDPEMFGVPTGAVAANDALEREYQAARANPMQYGTDVVNRGMIAGLAGAPVDMTNEVLKQFGLGSEKPFGGSESIGSGMESMGMVSPERHMVGELGAGLVDPFSTAATGAKLAHGMTAMMPLMTAYHGSPHKFEAFDASKIGTGEGAQAYGHGLYLAENPAVAKEYANMPAFKQAIVENPEILGKGAKDFIGRVEKLGGVDKAKQEAQELLSSMKENGIFPAVQNQLQNEIELANKYGRKLSIKQTGIEPQFYTVDLPDEHIEKMLDWDKPISKQPEEFKQLIQDVSNNENFDPFEHLAIAKVTGQHPRNAINYNPTGEELFNNVSDILGVERNSPEMSNILSNYGLKGVKYLDQQSRGISEGTRNFVIFPGEEDKLKILSRNGEPVNPTELTPEQRQANQNIKIEGVKPGQSWISEKDPNVEKLAKNVNKFLYHSDVAHNVNDLHYGIEPQQGGPWIKEIASGAVDDPEELLSRMTPLSWFSDDPTWVKMKVSRHLDKPLNQITEEDIKNHGHLALINKKDPNLDELWRVGEEGLGEGQHSKVTNLKGEQMPAYMTNLYNHNDNLEPFGVERNEWLATQPVEPFVQLTGDALVRFLKKTGHLSRGGSVTK